MTVQKIAIEELFGLNDAQKKEFKSFYNSPEAQRGRLITRLLVKKSISQKEASEFFKIDLSDILMMQRGSKGINLSVYDSLIEDLKNYQVNTKEWIQESSFKKLKKSDNFFLEFGTELEAVRLIKKSFSLSNASEKNVNQSQDTIYEQSKAVLVS